ncbi:porin [Paraburkholderia agricolaris]|uniref:Porin n=1 Tax=Paraburkholderia agricolaris TaxID=2152888 RepID=A0ABW9A167_9BURK
MKVELCAAALVAATASTAQAQDSIDIFGMIDAGITYVSNEHGHSNLKFDDGIYAPNLVGLKGNEDLGGGNRAFFELSSQFSLGNGGFVGNPGFGRTAFIGLGNDRLGTLTLGNQYDFMSEALFFGGNDSARDAGGLYNFRNGPFQKLALPNNPTGAFDWDRLGATQRVQNSVKYASASIYGVSLGAMYGFKDPTSVSGLENTQSVGVTYACPSFGAGTAYTNQRYAATAGLAATSITNWGAGAHFSTGALTATLLFSIVRNSSSDAEVWMTEVGATWHFTHALTLAMDYLYMKGNAENDNNHAHQVDALLQYAVSDRTALYVAGVYQRASSGAYAQINGVLDANGSSSGAAQAIARVGFHTAF